MNIKKSFVVVLTILFFNTALSPAFAQINQYSKNKLEVSSNNIELIRKILAYKRGEIQLTKNEIEQIKRDAYIQLEDAFQKISELDDNDITDAKEYLPKELNEFLDNILFIAKSDMDMQGKIDALLVTSSIANCAYFFAIGVVSFFISDVIGVFCALLQMCHISLWPQLQSMTMDIGWIMLLAGAVCLGVGGF